MKKKNLLLTAIAIFGLTTITFGQTVPSYVPTSGLVGWWPFNGNANDISGNGNNGTNNGASLTADRFGNANSAYNFSGGSSVSVPMTLLLHNLPVRTFSCWFNANGAQNGGRIYETTYLNGGIAMYNGNVLDAWYYNGTNECNVTNIITGNLNQWHHLVYVTDSNTGLGSIYLDGVFIDSRNGLPFTSPSNWLNNFLRFGLGAQGESFIGKIDDIGIWNRALTQEEITNLYNGCQLTVNTQPNSQTININNNAQFEVGSSDPSATFQWQTDLGVGFQNLNSVGQFSGATTNTLSVSNVTLSNNNQPFRCIVSSGSCSDTSNVAVLTVNNNVGINETTQDNIFTVFPNPAQSIINVKADNKLIGDIYTIYDNTGRVVLTGKINAQNTTIELGNLSGGIYLFIVGENMKQTFKIIKE
jgi:hypothetical protein